MSDEVPVGKLLSLIVAVLSATLLISLAGLVGIAFTDGEGIAAETLTHIAETVLGVFVGIAAGMLSNNERGS